MRTMRGSQNRGFTLVELLVVVSIIALLIAILLPSLQMARKQAKAVICMTNVRSLAQAAFTYYTETGVLPPSVSNFQPSTNKWGLDWLGVGDQFGVFKRGTQDDPDSWNPKGFGQAPTFGLLFPLVKDEKAYLCPEDKPGPSNNSPTGGGGNGKFSYTMFASLGLRPLERIPTRREEVSGGSRGGSVVGKLLPKRAFAKIPLFVEEHPWTINTIDKPFGGHMEGNFNTSDDRVVMRHPPFSKRPARDLEATGAPFGDLKQGVTEMGFADGHVEPVPACHGLTMGDVKKGARYEGRIPSDADSLLWYYGIDHTKYIFVDPRMQSQSQ